MFLKTAPPPKYRGDGGNDMAGEAVIEPSIEMAHYIISAADRSSIRTLRLYDDDVVICSHTRDGRTERRGNRLEHGGTSYFSVLLADSGIFDLKELQIDPYAQATEYSKELYVRFAGREKTVCIFNRTPEDRKLNEAISKLEELAAQLMN
jgi:hypothetical protein